MFYIVISIIFRVTGILLQPLMWVAAMGTAFYLRHTIRTKFEIKGSVFDDLLVSIFCTGCALSQVYAQTCTLLYVSCFYQMARHVYNYGQSYDCVCSGDGRPDFEMRSQMDAAAARSRQSTHLPIYSIPMQPTLTPAANLPSNSFNMPNSTVFVGHAPPSFLTSSNSANMNTIVVQTRQPLPVGPVEEKTSTAVVVQNNDSQV